MLRGLNIQNMLIIDRLELEFQAGLNVLTGETGAGKSILLDCLGFVLGWRGRAELVRKGAKQGEVTAWFDISSDHPVRAVLEDAGVSIEDEIILRRTNSPDGRKTAYLNDRRCSGELLRSVSDTLIELHGQHDDRGLLNVNGHRALLDDFADTQDLRAICRTDWRALAQAQKALTAQQAVVAAAAEEEDFLRHAHKELAVFAPEVGEAERLDTQRRLMQGAEKIRDDVQKASEVMGLNGAEGGLTDAVRWLETAASKLDGTPMDAALASLSRAMSELGEAQQAVDQFGQTLTFNPSELEAVEDRLFALRGLARKHDVDPDTLPEFLEKLTNKVDLLDNTTGSLEALEGEVATCQIRFDTSAAALSKARKSAATLLDKSMAAELAPLKLDRAVFETTFDTAVPGPDGTDVVAFRVAPNPGAPAGPINKIASGGELSRFLLALKVCLTKDQQGLTLIFDEIDRGVGGATADAVGRRLADLGQDAQVLVVTHSPQVAAQGDAHWRVEKHVTGDETLSTVVPLSQEQRTEEIARMLSGDRITAEALAAAQALMDA